MTVRIAVYTIKMSVHKKTNAFTTVVYVPSCFNSVVYGIGGKVAHLELLANSRGERAKL
jgi:hypothetical protein